MHINPARAAYDAMQALPRGEPCQMLNLVRLRAVAHYPAELPPGGAVPAPAPAGAAPPTGAEAYARYGELARPVFAAVGGQILWSGTPRLTLIGPEAEAWDIAFIAAYPAADAFLAMVANPQYQAAVIHRTAAVADSRLIRMAPRAGGGGFG